VTHFWSLGRTIASCVALRLPRVSATKAPDLRFVRAHDAASLLAQQPTEAQMVRAESPSMALLKLGPQYGLEFKHHSIRLRFVFDLDANEVRFASTEDVEDELLASILEGPVLGMMLRLSGQALLHASAVRWRGHGIAISADSGHGKSTLAALLCQHGASAWTDDVLAYTPNTAQAFGDARPSRLSPQSQEAAGLTHEGAAIYDGSHKLFSTPIPTLSDLHLQAQSLDHILILGARVDSDQPEMTTLTGTRASAAILTGRFPSWLREARFQREAFEAAEALTKHVPVTVIHLPDGLLRLRESIHRLSDWLDKSVPHDT